MTPGLGGVVWTPEQRRVTLAKLIKSGGAGSVYLLGDGKGQVAKIYLPGAGLDDYRRKIAAMLQLSPSLPDIEEGGQRFVQIA